MTGPETVDGEPTGADHRCETAAEPLPLVTPRYAVLPRNDRASPDAELPSANVSWLMSSRVDGLKIP